MMPPLRNSQRKRLKIRQRRSATSLRTTLHGQFSWNMPYWILKDIRFSSFASQNSRTNQFICADYEFRLQEKIEVRIPKEDLASHTARRTFVVTAYNEGVPLDLIMLITSHSDVKAMKPYLKGNLKGSNRVIEALNKASH